MKVNPNRMELLKLRRRLVIARRGHKLLRDKFDELMKQFIAKSEDVRRLRRFVHSELARAYALYIVTCGQMPEASCEAELMDTPVVLMLETTHERLVGVTVPSFDPQLGDGQVRYGLTSTPALLDEVVRQIQEVTLELIRLAEAEGVVDALSREMERVRRRVNALEYVLIPQLESTIKTIAMKLDEMDRETRTRVMKVKEMLAGDQTAV